MKILDSVSAIVVGATATEVDVGYRGALIKNNSETVMVYFKGQEADEDACTPENGYPLDPGESLYFPIRAQTLSIVADGDSADVRIMYVSEE